MPTPDYPDGVSDTAVQLARGFEAHLKTQADKVIAQYDRGLITTAELTLKLIDICSTDGGF